MAKLKMKSVRIVALRKDRKRLLEHLQDSSLIQIERTEKSPKGFEKLNMSSQMQVFERNAVLTEQALKILDGVAPQKTGLLDSFKGTDEIDPDKIGELAGNAKDILSICTRITELNKKIAENAAEQVRIKTSLAQLEPWQTLDIPINTQDSARSAVIIGSLPREYTQTTLSETIAELDTELEFDFEIVSTESRMTCIVLFTPLAQKSRAEAMLRELGFMRPMTPTSHTPKVKCERLIKKSQELEEQTKSYEEEIKSYADKRKDIEYTQDYFKIRADKYKVIGELDQTRNVFVITGYVPEEDEKKLEALCTRVADCCIEFTEADETKAPVKLKNNKFAEPAQGIVSMYSPPSHEDIDPTPILAFFYYFFFGMMFSDAGYGLLMVIATGLMIKIFKPDKKMRNNLKLFQYCGVSTTLWGCVFASFFGDAPAVLYNYFTGASVTMKELIPWPTLDPQKDAMLLMAVSIALGLVHILVGMGCKFYVCFRKKDYAAAFFDTGLWMLMLVGFGVLAVGMMTAPVVMYIGAGIAIACAVGLVLTQGRSKKGFGKVISGLASLYDITGYVSDLLSYSRLLALGLTTGVMAQVFNMLATMFGTSWIAYIPLLLVFVVGHLVNIGLNALGSYVHTMRLQYVEMFGKFYEGGGQEFTPFSADGKHFKIQEDKK